jgi:LmbE family N-acetylglucosaminyl deacetylase
MALAALDHLPPCDSLYVSPHADDVALSCAGRLVHEKAEGLKILVVILFGPGLDGPFGSAPHAQEGVARALVRLGVEHFAAQLPQARRRSLVYKTYAGLVEARDPGDDAWAAQAAELLAEVGHRTRARQVYAPLAVGSHIDHRLAHDAACAAFSGEGRNVFLYEERPEALVRGAVRMRLGQIGARLPPAADVAEPASALRYLLRFHVGGFRGDIRGWQERLRSAAPAWRQWRAGRAWNPQRSLGPRLQPVVYTSEGPAREALSELRAAAPRSLDALARRYGKRLGAGEYAERYWLLLPARQTDGQEALPPASVTVKRG